MTIKLSQVGSERDYSKMSEFAKMEAKSYENLLRQKDKKRVTIQQKEHEMNLPIK